MNDVESRLRSITERRKQGEQSDNRYNEASRARLLRIIKKKNTTTFIGALSRFEQYFGKLWGHGKTDSECTPEQLEWRQIWEECRAEVLNNGNNQQRALESELGEYIVNWLRHNTVLEVAK